MPTKRFSGAAAAWRLSLASLFIAATCAAQGGEVRHLFLSANLGDEYGAVANWAGDVDHDGYDDVIVGAPVDGTVFSHAGAAKVYSGATGQVIYALSGTGSNQSFGLGVACAGDVNGDGTPDILCGQAGNGSTWLGPGGGAKIFSGLTGGLLYTFGGSVFNDSFGQTLDGLGDLNGDGFGEVIVGTAFAPGAGNPGYARVYSGIDGSVLYAKSGTFNGQRYGIAVSSAGDVNNDGINDFVIGAIGNNANGANSGSVFVYSGATGGLLFTKHGTSAGNQLGYSVGSAGDVNHDGFDDVIAGTYIPGGIGYARVFSGATGTTLFEVQGSVVGDAFGHTIAGVGDVNGDSYPDFASAAPNSNVNGTESGLVRVYSGQNAALLREFVGSQADIHLGYAVNRAGDVNGDGLPDIVLGSLVSASTGVPGRAIVVSTCAAEPYGIGLAPTQTLTMYWIKGAPGHEAEGGPGIFGAAPNAPGLIGVSLGPANAMLYDVPVLFNGSPGVHLLFGVFYSPSGTIEIPVLLRNPMIAGVTLYAQAFELNPSAPQGIYASNALAMLFGN